MSYSKLLSIPTNRLGLTQPVVLSKRVAACRRTYKNRRKLQAIPGQIVYIISNCGKKVIPMRILAIDDCAVWACRDWKTRGDFMIYYDLQPLTRSREEWRAKPWRQTQGLGWQQWNKRLRDSGWIGHAIDMDEFYLTSAEANWSRMCR